jgi:glycerophosphoryl diester phosphodiesterase
VHALTGPHGRPVEAFARTVDDVSTARPVAGYGVDGVITNKPDVVWRALYRY